MPGACVLHASVPVFPSHVQPFQGGYVTNHRSSSIHTAQVCEAAWHVRNRTKDGAVFAVGKGLGVWRVP